MPGAALRVAAGSGPWGVSALCGWLAQTPMSLPGERGTVILERFPCALGPTLRLLAADGRIEFNFDGGAALGALLVTGQGFTPSYGNTRFEVGARVAVDAALHWDAQRTGFSPVVGIEASYFPVPYDLDVRPRVSVSQAPQLWAALTAGVCWNFE